MEVNFETIEMIKLMSDSDIAKQTDDKIKEYKFCYDYDSSSHILKMIIGGILIVSDRAAIMFNTVQRLNNGSYAHINFSIDTDKVEVDSSCVLANCTMYVSLYEEISENSCRVTNITHTDPNGNIPSIL